MLETILTEELKFANQGYENNCWVISKALAEWWKHNISTTIRNHLLIYPGLNKVYNGNTRTKCYICSKLQNDFVLVSLSVNLNRFCTLFCCFHYWLWANKCWLGYQLPVEVKGAFPGTHFHKNGKKYPFIPNAPILYSLKASEIFTVFWCFQGVEKGCIGNKWVNSLLNH